MLYLSQAIGRPVRDRQGEPIGKVADLIVALGGQYPPVTGLVVSTDRRRIFLPWSSVETLDTVGRASADEHDRHRQVPPAPQRDPASAGPPGQADRGHRRPQGRPGQRPAPGRDRGDEPAGRGGRRRRRACSAGSASRGRTGRSPATSACRCPSATSTGRTSTRSRARSRRSSCACRTPALRELHPADLATIIDQLGRKDRAGVLAIARRRGGRRRHRGDGARDPGRGARGPRTGARGRHPRGDEPRRRGRPRGRPLGDRPRGDPRADGARGGGRGQGAAALPRGHGRRHHDHRVRRRPGDADRRRRRSTGCASWSPTPRRSTTSTSPTTTAGSSACSRCAT